MTALIITAHPDTRSLTHRSAHTIEQLLPAGQSRIAHLAQEGFDPRFTAADRRAYQGHRKATPDVLAEQERIDDYAHLVLVFPVYWWTLPALLKGWLDRVFIAGWAFHHDAQGRLVARLEHVTAHLVPITGTDAASFARHGYAQSFATQVHRGVFAFCGMKRGATAFVYDAESRDKASVVRDMRTAARIVASAVHASTPGNFESSAASAKPTGLPGAAT